MDRSVPTDFAQRMVTVFGEAGRDWTAALPALIAEYAQRWGLTVGAPYTLSFSYAAPARRADGLPVVLKLRVPHRDAVAEVNALRHYGGQGCARLLEADEERGALLLEQLRPGTLLSALPDDQATAIAADVMMALRRPLPAAHLFPSVDDWMLGLTRLRKTHGGGTGGFPATLVEKAEGLYVELQQGQTTPVLLHGDLHHYNILAAERAPWLAIDPQGVIGEPAFEAGALLRNPSPEVFGWPDLARITARRIDILTERTGLDRWRLTAWALAGAVLSEWWNHEDGSAPETKDLAVAEVLATMV